MKSQKERDLEHLLSAYADGEVTPEERAEIERALEEDEKLQARLDDHLLVSSLLRSSLEREADEVDFSGFADRVMERLPAHDRPTLWKRLGVWIDETLTFHRWQAASGLAVVVTLLIGGPLIWNAVREPPVAMIRTPSAGTQDAQVQAPTAVLELETAEDTDAMLFQTASGTTVIFVQGNDL